MQEFIVNQLEEVTRDIDVLASSQVRVYLTDAIFEEITANANALPSGTVIGLKKILDQESWGRLDHNTRRNLGKEFKVAVDMGDFPFLKKGEKKKHQCR